MSPSPSLGIDTYVTTVVLYLQIHLYAQLHNKILAGPYTTGTVLQTKRVHFAFWDKLVYNFKITSSVLKKEIYHNLLIN